MSHMKVGTYHRWHRVIRSRPLWGTVSHPFGGRNYQGTLLSCLDTTPHDNRKTLTSGGTESKSSVRGHFGASSPTSLEGRRHLHGALIPVDFLAVCEVLNLGGMEGI